jgi:hypothetical protein
MSSISNIQRQLSHALSHGTPNHRLDTRLKLLWMNLTAMQRHEPAPSGRGVGAVYSSNSIAMLYTLVKRQREVSHLVYIASVHSHVQKQERREAKKRKSPLHHLAVEEARWAIPLECSNISGTQLRSIRSLTFVSPLTC